MSLSQVRTRRPAIVLHQSMRKPESRAPYMITALARQRSTIPGRSMRRTARRLGIALLAANLLAMAAPAATAAELKIGLAADVSSLDPHYLNIAPNISLASHLFDTLVLVDANGKLVPGLATSWRAVDDTTWEFKLRRGVKFHDGSEMTADDVLFSLDRPATLAASPGPFTSYTRQIVSKKAVDPYTVQLKTATPYGPLPLDMNSIFIVSKKARAERGHRRFQQRQRAGRHRAVQVRRLRPRRPGRHDPQRSSTGARSRPGTRSACASSPPARAAGGAAGRRCRPDRDRAHRRPRQAQGQSQVHAGAEDVVAHDVLAHGPAGARARPSSPTAPASRWTKTRWPTCGCGWRCRRRSIARR